jgi:hypothetical protein
MSSAGRAANSSDCITGPREQETGLSGFAAQIRCSSLTGSYVMATAEHREPYESRGSRTVLGAPGGEIPPGDSTLRQFGSDPRLTGHVIGAVGPARMTHSGHARCALNHSPLCSLP